MELITIILTREAYDSVLDILPPHEVKKVVVKDNTFRDDPVHKELKSVADKAYRKLQEFEFKKRNNIPL